jgi:hypothetical protein
MNKNLKASPKTTAGQCLCQGAGPWLSDFLRQIGPPEPARRHFEAARLEVLKGLRALLDARIEKRRKPDGKGKKIAVE